MKNQIEDNCVVITCPPYPQYEEQPKDQSHCELSDCPRCKGKMWLSEKKKEVLRISSSLNKQIILGCYHCIEKLIRDNQEFFLSSDVVKIP